MAATDTGLSRTALAGLWEAVSGPANGRGLPGPPAVSPVLMMMKGLGMVGKQRGRGAAQTLLGLAVVAFIAYQAVRAWWQRNRDQLLAGFGQRLWEDLPSVLLVLALATGAVTLLRWQASRGPARGVDTAVTLAELAPAAPAGSPGPVLGGGVLEQLTTELIIRDGGTAQRRPAGSPPGVDVAGTTTSGRPLIVACQQVSADTLIPLAMIHNLVRAGQLAGTNPLMLFVTTGGFADQTWTEARFAGVHLVDRSRLGAWMGGGYLVELGRPRTPWSQRVRAGLQWARQAQMRLTGGSQWPPR
jgi:hypothetical protein